ncbi:MAG: cobalamin-dependent protein [Thermodesulfobacteriota bacterium]
MQEEILEKMKQAVLAFDPKAAADLARTAIAEGVDPLAIMDKLTEAVKIVGDAFGRGVMFLPELVGAADALQAAMPTVEEAIKNRGQKRRTLGKVVIGTVAGDIHTIGKSMVASLLTADGFEVHDLGIDVPADKFVESVKEYDARFLGLSALLTTTAPQCRVVIEKLKETGLRDRVKVMVGGGAITAEFARVMGADGYRPTAPGAVELVRSWISG